MFIGVRQTLQSLGGEGRCYLPITKGKSPKYLKCNEKTRLKCLLLLTEALQFLGGDGQYYLPITIDCLGEINVNYIKDGSSNNHKGNAFFKRPCKL
jgi:hypothetical protein